MPEWEDSQSSSGTNRVVIDLSEDPDDNGELAAPDLSFASSTSSSSSSPTHELVPRASAKQAQVQLQGPAQKRSHAEVSGSIHDGSDAKRRIISL